MRTTIGMTSMALAGLLLLGAGCANKTPTSTVSSPDVHANADDHADAERWAVDTANSTLTWNASKVTGKHVGTIQVQSGALLVHDGAPVGGSFTIDMASIVNDDLTDAAMNERLVNHLKSDDFFAVATHPTAQFDIITIEEIGGNTYLVLGNITIKGITKMVNFEATIDVTADQATATGTVTLDRTDFDIKFRSGKFFGDLGDSLIHDQFTLTLDVQAKK